MPFSSPLRWRTGRRAGGAGASASGGGAGTGAFGRWAASPGSNQQGAPPNFNTAFQAYTQFNQPQFDQFAQQAAAAQRDNGFRNQGYDIQQQDYYNQYGTGNQNIDLDYAQNGVDQAAANRQIGFYDQMYGVDVSRYNSDMAYQSGNQVFADGRYAIAGQDLALDDKTYGIAGERYGLQGQTHNSVLAQIGNQAAMAQRTAFEDKRDTASDATKMGAFTAAGHGWDREDISAALGFKLTDLGEQTKQEQVNRQQQGLDYKEAGIRNERDHLDYDKEALAYMQQTSDIAHNKDNLGYDLQEAGLNKDEQQARLRDRLQALDIQAQRLGVNRQELQNKLQTALANLGLDRQISMGQLTDMMNSANNGNNQLLNNIIQQAMAVGQTTKPVQRRTAPLPTRRRTATNRGPVAFSRKTR